MYQFYNNINFCHALPVKQNFFQRNIYLKKRDREREKKKQEKKFNEEREEEETMNRRKPSMMYAYSMERAQN